MQETAAGSRFHVRGTPPSSTTRVSNHQGGRCNQPDCKAELGLLRRFSTLSHIVHDQPPAFREPGRDANGVLPRQGVRDNGSFIASATDVACKLVPSSKLTATMAVIGTWQQEHPNDKIIGTDGTTSLLTADL